MTQAKQIVESYYAAFQKKDFALVRSILDDAFTFTGPMMQATSADDMMEKMAGFDCEYSNTVHEMIADGESVAVRFTCSMGSENPVELSMSEWFTVRDGKIASVNLFFDTAQMAEMRDCMNTAS